MLEPKALLALAELGLGALGIAIIAGVLWYVLKDHRAERDEYRKERIEARKEDLQERKEQRIVLEKLASVIDSINRRLD